MSIDFPAGEEYRHDGSESPGLAGAARAARERSHLLRKPCCDARDERRMSAMIFARRDIEHVRTQHVHVASPLSSVCSIDHGERKAPVEWRARDVLQRR